jgi:putative phage-type endonuclease
MQRTEEWYGKRTGRFTASQIFNLLMKPTTAGYQNYIAQIVAERLTGESCGSDFVSEAMQNGIDLEPRARTLYEIQTGGTVEEIDFIVHPGIPNLGASPDGLVDDGLIEIKCRNLANHIKVLLGTPVDRNAMIQMQTQMMCADVKWCDYVHFNPNLPAELQLHVQRVEADPELQEQIGIAVEKADAEVEYMIAKLQTKQEER